jgi:predicted nucleic acid-binding protein
MKGVFCDTVYFLALLNPTDQFHAAALAYSQNAQQTLITTEWVLTEVGDALWQPANRRRLGQLLAILSESRETEIVQAESSWFQRGCELFLARPDKEWSLTDCISFLVMKEHGISEALTGDHHFEQAGFTVLLHP